MHRLLLRAIPRKRHRKTLMAKRYDVIVIGGGHNGLVNAAYLAKAGKKVLVLERRYILGGAAVTEEIIPGFKFSVFSYVVSLLRPEIIRDLDLPRHGMEILPLDGTITPMQNGDYLWRENDHGRTRRELERHSKLDAEAYEEFGKSMVAMCRFVKPILGMIPPDPSSLDPRDLKKLAFLGKRFQSLAAEDKYNLVQLMTMSAADFLESLELFWGFGRRVPRTFCCITTWGKLTGRFARGDSVEAAPERFQTRLAARRKKQAWEFGR